MNQPRALVIHHLRTGSPDLATTALEHAGFALDHRYPIEGDRLPSLDEGHAVALVHGSLADVTIADAPGISEERRWIDAWWASERPYFGICHGLQLAAQHLGARVGPPEHGRAEFGYYPLLSTHELVPDGLHVFQWHYYGADLPEGAERLAGSHLYPNQVVRFGSARYGLQCHAELSLDSQSYLRAQDPRGMDRPGSQGPDAQAVFAKKHFQSMRDWMSGFLRNWLAEARDEVPNCRG